MVIHHAYPDWVMDQRKNLVWDQFYHGLAPSLRDVMMAELPEREQASTSFDTLYMLAKKMEAHQPSHLHGEGRVLLMHTGISTGDILLPQDELQYQERKSCTCLTLNPQILRCQNQISLRA